VSQKFTPSLHARSMIELAPVEKVASGVYSLALCSLLVPTSSVPNTNLPPIQLSSRNSSVASVAITILALTPLVSRPSPTCQPVAEGTIPSLRP